MLKIMSHGANGHAEEGGYTYVGIGKGGAVEEVEEVAQTAVRLGPTLVGFRGLEAPYRVFSYQDNEVCINERPISK
jgi:hypothetical protein